MSVIRRKITSCFTTIPNTIITADSGLSIDARWLLIYLLSRPADWVVRIADIQAQGGVGREKAQNMLRDLVAAGWVRKDLERGEGGQWSGVDYVVMDQPEGQNIDISPQTEKPSPVPPSPVNQPLTKDGPLPKTESTNSSAADAAMDADFEEFWAAYPKRPNNPKQPAKAKYLHARRRLHASRETLVNAARAYASSRAGQDPTYTAMAATWLNQRRWEEHDEPAALQVATDGIDPLKVEALRAMYPGNSTSAGTVCEAIVRTGVASDIDAVTVAAEMFKLLLKQERYDGFERAVPTLENFINFRWRDMLRDYEFCHRGITNKKTVRPKKVKA